jgi:hypothetical protein
LHFAFQFAEHLGQDQWSSMADALRDYLLTIVEAMNDIDEVRAHSFQFGSSFFLCILRETGVIVSMTSSVS